jgi:hypothetical protein
VPKLATVAPAIHLPGAGQPLFRGPHGPVPHIAKWSAEVDLEAPLVETVNGLAYADELSIDRDNRGLLWSRVAVRPGVGEPIYRELHPLRQRRAMRWLLCQVCAGPADQNEHGALWLIRDDRGQWPGWPEGAQNTQPPLCLRCARISVKTCPWLRDAYVAVRAQSFVSGASGTLYRTGGRNARPIPADVTNVRYEDPRIRWLQADQLERELMNCTFVELD